MSTADVPVSSNDLLDALAFAQRRFDEWQQQRQINDSQHAAVSQRLQTLRERIRSAGDVSGSTLRGMPAAAPGESGPARTLRYLNFLTTLINGLAERNTLRLSQTHALLDEVQQRQRAVARKLNPDEIPDAVPVAELAEGDDLAPIPALPVRSEPARSDVPRHLPQPAGPSRNFLELLLDPRNIQYLLAFGGALMVVGVIILLWVNQFFTPPVVAISLAVGNVAVLVAGWYLVRATSMQTAGRALTLLACLVMPLNIWYLNANSIDVKQMIDGVEKEVSIGEWAKLDRNLWGVGVAIVALYFISALVLRDRLFVYISNAGVALAGLLIIASLKPPPEMVGTLAYHFWGIAAPSTLLVVLGLIAIHLERIFVDDEGPFSRKKFGLAFFFSGHVQLAAGLLLLLGAFVYGDWLKEPFKQLVQDNGKQFITPTVVGQHMWLSAVLLAASVYGYVYSDLIVRRLGVYVHVAGFLLAWLVVVLIELTQIPVGVELVIALLAGVALVVNIIQGAALGDNKYTRAFPILGVLLPLAAVLIGIAAYFKDVDFHWEIGQAWKLVTLKAEWPLIGALALTAVSCRVGAWIHRDKQSLAALYHFGTAAALMTGAAALLTQLGITEWKDHAPLLMLIPIAYVVAGKAYQGPTRKPMLAVAHTGTVVMLMASFLAAVQGFTLVREREMLNLMLALFFGEVALFYALTAGLHKQVPGVVLGAVAGCAAVWQVCKYYSLPDEAYTIVFAVAGLALILVYRLVQSDALKGSVARTTFDVGNALLSLSFVSCALMGMARLQESTTNWNYVSLCGAQTGLSLLAVMLVRASGWRRWYVVTFIGLAALTLLALLRGLDPIHKAEVISIGIGTLLLIAAHIGWFSETQDRENELVTLGMLFGSLAAGVPLAIGAINDRVADRWIGADSWTTFHELGWLIAAMFLFASGFMLRLKATTVVGGLLLALYFVTLVIYLPWSRMSTVALAMTIGGGTMFGLGLILSIFRETLLKLPEHIKKREGVFQVLMWR